MTPLHSIYFCCAFNRADSHRDSLELNSVCCSFLSFLRCRAQPFHSLLCPLVCRILQLSLNTSFGIVCGAQAHPYLGSDWPPPSKCEVASPYNVSVYALQVKDATQHPQMVFTVRHATVTFETEGDPWTGQKERRAALMVGILIGVFVLCWFPFFVTELISPLCSWDIPAIWKSIFLWLGYSNSFFNPLIYTAFNRSYSSAFKVFFSKQQ